MPYKGVPPKDPAKRARRNKDPHPVTTIPFVRCPQPSLPEMEEGWSRQTVLWWEMWGRSAQAEHFTEPDWFFLMDTALIYEAMWSKGHLTLAAETRLRVGKFGATPDDRAKLRMTFVDADEKEAKATSSKPLSSRDKYGSLHLIDGENAVSG